MNLLGLSIRFLGQEVKGVAGLSITARTVVDGAILFGIICKNIAHYIVFANSHTIQYRLRRQSDILNTIKVKYQRIFIVRQGNIKAPEKF